MIIAGIIFLSALAGLAVGLTVAPDHSFRGTAATIDILALLVSGTVLAVHAL